MAKGVQGLSQTIKLDEHYQINLKMSMTKLEPKDVIFLNHIIVIICQIYLSFVR